LAVTIGIFLLKGTFDFTGPSDATYERYFGEKVMMMRVADREAAYLSDTIRSLVYVLLATLAIWLFLKEKIKRNLLIIILGILIVVDLVGIDLRYVGKDNFVRQRRMDQPFQEMAFDKQIEQDKGIFRVYDPAQGFNSARTSYFHQSITGYHGAKPAGMQDLFDFHIYKNNIDVLNMLNVKYVIQQDEEGGNYAALNPEANGNAWFIQNLISVKNADEELLALDSLDVKNEAVVNTGKVASVNRFNFQKDSTALIRLTNYEPNHLTYQSENTNEGVAVFSEMYYPNGWNAYIDGTITPHFKVNYVLRALKVPAGNHTIEFKFEPTLISTGSKITLASSILLGLLVMGGLGYSLWTRKKKKV
jgi:hypothetical protein